MSFPRIAARIAIRIAENERWQDYEELGSRSVGLRIVAAAVYQGHERADAILEFSVDAPRRT